jgi:hypothetical protein
MSRAHTASSATPRSKGEATVKSVRKKGRREKEKREKERGKG